MRIAIAGISHETNTYCREPTRLSDFHLLRGERLLETRGQQTDVGGAVSACEALGVEPVPLLYAGAQPSGTIEQAVYEQLKVRSWAGWKRPDRWMAWSCACMGRA